MRRFYIYFGFETTLRIYNTFISIIIRRFYNISHLISYHVFNYLSSLSFNYNNVFGFILIILYSIQLISGLLLTVYYSSYYLYTFDSLFYIIFNVNYGYLIRLFHLMGSFLFIIFIYIHFLRSLYYIISFTSLNYSFYIIYLSGVFILLLSLAISFLGYSLIWGQMSY